MDENNKGSGGKLDGFFNGKGFYIVLFLCAAVIGVSAWSLLSGNRTVQKDDIGDISLSATAAPTPAAVTPAPAPAAKGTTSPRPTRQCAAFTKRTT